MKATHGCHIGSSQRSAGSQDVPGQTRNQGGAGEAKTVKGQKAGPNGTRQKTGGRRLEKQLWPTKTCDAPSLSKKNTRLGRWEGNPKLQTRDVQTGAGGVRRRHRLRVAVGLPRASEEGVKRSAALELDMVVLFKGPLLNGLKLGPTKNQNGGVYFKPEVRKREQLLELFS